MKISQGIHRLSDYTVVFIQNSEGGGDGDNGNSCAVAPSTFSHFRRPRPKFNVQPISFTFETSGKKLAKA
jgi:hypothetical protein